MRSSCCKAEVFTKEKNGAVSIYCKNCGKYVKNATKEEKRMLEFQSTEKMTTIVETKEESLVSEKLKRFIQAMEFEIKKEDEKLPLSDIDAARKSSKVYELSRVINSLENILLGNEYNSNN